MDEYFFEVIKGKTVVVTFQFNSVFTLACSRLRDSGGSVNCCPYYLSESLEQAIFTRETFDEAYIQAVV